MVNDALVRNMRAISPVWIVPVVALAIAIWLAVQARLERGTEIQITFTKASDILAGQTLIKLKDVEVGMVKNVRLSEDLTSVVVTAEIDRAVSGYLSENTRFWVVTPRISATGVSNLGTLISGVYIVMDPGENGKSSARFEGLDEPPAYVSDEEGTPYILRSEELGSLDIGSPIYFRQIRVGEVTGYRLSKNRKNVDVSIFIRAPHDSLIHEQSRFWNVSGFGVSIGAEGMKAEVASLASIISGGIAFDNPGRYDSLTLANSGRRFFLHPDRESVLEGEFDIEYFYMTKFSRSVRGLSVGAPVEFRGIKVGEVVDIKLVPSETEDGELQVMIGIEPQRLYPDTSLSREETDSKIDALVSRGLRAQLKTGSLITGSRFIDLAFFEDAPDQAFERREKFSLIPSVEDSVDLIARQVGELVTKINQIPFEDIGRDLAGSMSSLNRMLADLERRNTTQKVDRAVAEMETTLKNASLALENAASAMQSIDQTLAPDSEVKVELAEMLKSVSQAARSVQLLTDELNRHPNALISGAKKDE